MKVLGSRVDGLVFRYRMTLDPAFVEALCSRGAVAYRHGRAAFFWRNPKREPNETKGEAQRLRERFDTREQDVMWGELKYSRATKRWVINNQPSFQMVVDAQGPGAVEHDDEDGIPSRDHGFAIEIKFYAQRLADIGLDAAQHEAETLAALCGVVHEQRLGRIDLCADVEGWTIAEEDVRRLVKRPRARWQKEYGDRAVDASGSVELLRAKKGGRLSQLEREEEERAQDFGRGALDRRQITGLSVGRGGAMMTRIYDKRVELERDEERRANEEKRWTAAGWDGVSCVTRVEFQIRGTAIAEFGLRDPRCIKDVEWGESLRTGRLCVVAQRDAEMYDEETGEARRVSLSDRLDWIWRSCLEWVRLVEPAETKTGKPKALGLLDEDPRWILLREITFGAARAPSVIKRFRVRSAASAAMGLGVALSQAGKDGRLVLCPENNEETGYYDCDEETALSMLRDRVVGLMVDEGERIIEDLLRRGEGAIGGLVHLSVRSNAALYRHMGRGSDADLATGPPHGDGPRSAPFARRSEDDSTGSSEAGRAVA